MKLHTTLLLSLLLNCQVSRAIYGPSLVRADKNVVEAACQEGQFPHDIAIQSALDNERIPEIAALLPDVLKELKETSPTSPLYPARAFCVHDLVPRSIPAKAGSKSAVFNPPPSLAAFRAIGLDYFYYEPDARWTLRNDPVDLEALSTKYVSSRWGREAFLMMTQIGWSKGECQEGPDQFRRVILRGNAFLRRFPNDEVSNKVRLAVANAYATWWNLSQNPPSNKTTAYLKGASQAKISAVALYQRCLDTKDYPLAPPLRQLVEQRLTILRSEPKGSNSFEFYCADYED